MLEWFPRLIVLTVAVVVIALLVRYYTNRDVDSAQIVMTSHIHRLYYDDIIMYADETTKRVYPGTVDMDHFTEDRLKAAFPSHAKLGSCLTSVPEQGCSLSNTTICYNELIVQQGDAMAGQTGAGAPSILTEAFPVTLKKGAMRCRGTLAIHVVRLN
jgi:hypothetical protein